jgi:hypothetical protein
MNIKSCEKCGVLFDSEILLCNKVESEDYTRIVKCPVCKYEIYIGYKD